MALDLLPGAISDLRALRATDPQSWATIISFLQEVDSYPRLIDVLTTHGNIQIEKFQLNVKAWVQARRKSCNLYRLRILNSPATSYRVVYGYEWRSRRLGVLAVVHKDEFDYELCSDTADRIFNDWERAAGGRDT